MGDRFQPQAADNASTNGITQLTGDVLAGPGTGLQPATVVGLQGSPVAAAAPVLGDVLEWNGAAWAPEPKHNDVAIQTTNAVPVEMYHYTLAPASCMTLRATVVVAQTITAAIVGRFVRELTAERVGLGAAVLRQDLVPSPDFRQSPGLALASGVSANNATLTVTGIAGTLTWTARIDVVTT